MDFGHYGGVGGGGLSESAKKEKDENLFYR